MGNRIGTGCLRNLISLKNCGESRQCVSACQLNCCVAFIIIGPSGAGWAVGPLITLNPSQLAVSMNKEAMSFYCPHFDEPNDACTRLKKTCVPGRRGCVLRGKVRFADDPDARAARRDREGAVAKVRD